MNFISSVTTILSLGIILIQILTIVLIIILVSPKGKMYEWIHKNAIAIGLLFVSLATLGSLFYSDFVGFEPCNLCWILRILMFPQVLLLAIAWRAKDMNIAKYSFALSFFGVLISGYQYLLQIGIVPGTCSVLTDCSKRLIFTFGYITIPMMTFATFLFMAVLMLFVIIKNNGKKE